VKMSVDNTGYIGGTGYKWDDPPNIFILNTYKGCIITRDVDPRVEDEVFDMIDGLQDHLKSQIYFTDMQNLRDYEIIPKGESPK